MAQSWLQVKGQGCCQAEWAPGPPFQRCFLPRPPSSHILKLCNSIRMLSSSSQGSPWHAPPCLKTALCPPPRPQAPLTDHSPPPKNTSHIFPCPGGSKACEQDFHNSTACQRIGLARAFLSYGLDVTLSDADWAFAEDPRPFFSRQPPADLLAAGAALVNSTADGDGGLELAASLAAGTDDGLLLLRAAPAMLSFLQAWARALPGRNGQAALESALREGVGATPALWPGQDRLAYAWGGRLVLGVLPVARFGSHTASVQGLAGLMHVTQVRCRGRGRVAWIVSGGMVVGGDARVQWGGLRGSGGMEGGKGTGAVC